MILHFDQGGFILGPRMVKHIQTNKYYIPYQQKPYDHLSKCRKMTLNKVKTLSCQNFFLQKSLVERIPLSSERKAMQAIRDKPI